MKKLILIISLFFVFYGCEKENINPKETDVLKYEVINTTKSEIEIIYISDNYKIENFTTSENWTNEFPVFAKESYFIVVESDNEVFVNIYLNNELVRSAKGKDMIDINFAL